MTAKKAKNEAEEKAAVESAKPDFKRAIKVLAHDIGPIAEELSKLSGDASAAWKIIEDGCHVNKAAAKVFKRMTDMTPELRDSFLRSLYGLMATAKIGISQDLVDLMTTGGEVPKMPIIPKAAAEGDLATLN